MNELLLYLNLAGTLYLLILTWPKPDKRSTKKKKEDYQKELNDYIQKDKEDAETKALYIEENKEHYAVRNYRNSKKN